METVTIVLDKDNDTLNLTINKTGQTIDIFDKTTSQLARFLRKTGITHVTLKGFGSSNSYGDMADGTYTTAEYLDWLADIS